MGAAADPDAASDAAPQAHLRAVFAQGLWSSGLPQPQGELPISAQLRHDLTPQSNPTSPGSIRIQRADVVP